MKQQLGILGIRIDNLSKQDVEQRIADFLHSDSFHWIATVNPEILLHAYHDISFSEILNLSDLNVPDGFGLKWVGWMQGNNITARYPGVDMIDAIVRIAAEQNKTIMFLEGREKLPNGQTTTQKAAELLQTKYPNATIITQPPGEIYEQNGELHFDQGLISILNNSGAEVVLAALSNPVQEKFIFALRNHCPNIKLAVGIGGGFNLLSGYLRRAPKFFRKLGLEWAWRLVLEPRRWKRIFRAVVVFQWLFLYRKIIPRYRQGNMACIINADGNILLCKRATALPQKHWQMPQGGVDEGEGEEQALLRELCEELGTNSFEIIKRIPETHKYKITDSFRFSTNGQKIRPWIVRFIGNDADIKLDERELVDFQWVAPEQLLETIYTTRRESAKICLKYLKKSMPWLKNKKLPE